MFNIPIKWDIWPVAEKLIAKLEGTNRFKGSIAQDNTVISLTEIILTKHAAILINAAKEFGGTVCQEVYCDHEKEANVKVSFLLEFPSFYDRNEFVTMFKG